MSLIRDVKQSELFAMEGKARFDLFDQEIAVYVHKGGNLEYAERCVAYLNSLPKGVIDKLCMASIRYCNAFLADIGDPPMSFERPKDVLRVIGASVLLVPAEPATSASVIDLELNCEWEEEHGMQWVVRNDEVLYVGAYDGVDPLGDFDRVDEYNYAQSG